MKRNQRSRFAFITVILFLQIHIVFAQGISSYTKSTYMIPMRDGVKLFTVVYTPVAEGTYPVLILRTPYEAETGDNYDPLKNPAEKDLASDGYIFVYQDVRGKYKSEGSFIIHAPVTHVKKPGTVDESTDTYDTIDWLIKNLKNNNGKAGIYGISYPGWLALAGAVDPHPALKASSEQACMADLFLGDDFHHNGAFRLSYGFEYTYSMESNKEGVDFPFTQFDLYNWYLKLGSLKNVNEKYFKGKIPTWNSFVEHPNYDAFWRSNSTLDYVKGPEVPQLHVGGYYDQEDVNGPQLMYDHMEKWDSTKKNYIVLGPWNHGQWARGTAESLGRINFGSRTASSFLMLQKKWFDYWLKGNGDGNFDEANCFQTGSNVWKQYKSWPPKEAVVRKLYTHSNGTCSFEKPTQAKASVSYVSDPAKPVPYRELPIEMTYGPGSRWGKWHVDDQRFVSTRPDVLVFTADSLTDDLTVTGSIKAHLFVSTTGTDADFIVKLIDVYPDKYGKDLLMSQYQLPVAMEVFRGRFRKSFSNPQPFVPGKPEEIVIDLHQINHTFLKGHKIMVQVQSSWFPVIDRNPQKFVPNIFEAKDSDFIKATHTVHCNSQLSTYIELPVMKE